MTKALTTDYYIAPRAQRARPPGELSLSAILAFFRSSWKFMLPVALLVTLVGLGYALTAPPVYQADALIKVDISENSNRGVPANLSALFEAKSATTAEVEMTRTRSVLIKAVEQYKLDIIAQPKRFPIVGNWFARKSDGLADPGLFGHGHTAWGNESIEVSNFAVPPAMERKPFSLMAGADGAYRLQFGKSLNVVGMVGVELKQATPDGEISLLVNKLHAKSGVEFTLAKTSKEDAVEALQKTLVVAERGKQSGLIGISLGGQNPVLVAGIVNAVAQQYIQQNINLKTEDAERSLAFLESQLPELKAAIDAAEAKYSAFRNSRGTIDVGEEAKAVLQQSVIAQTRLAELRQRRAELSTRFQNDNPFVEGVNQQIKSVSGEISDINEKIRRIPGTEQDLVRLTRDVKVNTELYTALLNTAQQLRLARASRVGSAKLVDVAVPSSTPVGPKRGLIVVGSAIAGCILAMFGAFLRRAVGGSIETQEDLYRDVSVPVMAVVPHSKLQARSTSRLIKKQGRASLLAEDASEEGAVESLRTFRAALEHSSRLAPNNVVLFAGPTAGVGKSFIAANFSAVLARSGKRVLLIDADMREGHLHQYFGLERRAGLSDLIAGQAQIREAVSINVIEGLDFLSTGALRLQPGEALTSVNVGRLLAQFSSGYDYVVIDTAPVLAVADSLALSSHAGMIYCVARKGRTTVDQIVETTARFEQSGKAIDGIIFNDAVPSDLSYGYGADYRRRLVAHSQSAALTPVKT